MGTIDRNNGNEKRYDPNAVKMLLELQDEIEWCRISIRNLRQRILDLILCMIFFGLVIMYILARYAF